MEITKWNKAWAWIKWTILLPMRFFRKTMGPIFYPLAYYFRVWTRVTYYNYHNIPLRKVARNEEGMYPYKKTNKFTIIIATFLWWFLDDDAGEYADCGGTEQVEKYYDNDIGQTRDPEKLGGWIDWGMLIEKDITNKWRRFKCAYIWNALRNPAYNINRKYMIVDMIEPITTEITVSDGKDAYKMCRCKDKRGMISYYHSTFGKKVVYYKDAEGKVLVGWSKAVLYIDENKKKIICFAKKFGWALPYYRHTLSNRKYEFSFEGQEKDNYKRYLEGTCRICDDYNCDACKK